MTLIELLVTLAIIGLAAGLLPNFVTVSTKIPKAGSARSHVQEFRHVHLFIEKTIRSADTIVIDGHNVYVQDMETPLYYDLYTLRQETHILYRDKYYNSFVPLDNGSRSQLDAEVVDFELAPEWQGDTPNGRFRLKMQYTGDPNVYETEIYAPKHAQSVTVRTP
jgi:prepilin-type N-terminal cleavage/methylation domain-containing protein